MSTEDRTKREILEQLRAADAQCIVLMQERDRLKRESACPCCKDGTNLSGEICSECHGKGLAIVAYEVLRVHYKLQRDELDAAIRQRDAALRERDLLAMALREARQDCCCSIRERDSGHRTDCWTVANAEALALLDATAPQDVCPQCGGVNGMHRDMEGKPIVAPVPDGAQEGTKP